MDRQDFYRRWVPLIQRHPTSSVILAMLRDASRFAGRDRLELSLPCGKVSLSREGRRAARGALMAVFIGSAFDRAMRAPYVTLTEQLDALDVSPVGYRRSGLMNMPENASYDRVRDSHDWIVNQLLQAVLNPLVVRMYPDDRVRGRLELLWSNLKVLNDAVSEDRNKDQVARASDRPAPTKTPRSLTMGSFGDVVDLVVGVSNTLVLDLAAQHDRIQLKPMHGDQSFVNDLLVKWCLDNAAFAEPVVAASQGINGAIPLIGLGEGQWRVLAPWHDEPGRFRRRVWPDLDNMLEHAGFCPAGAPDFDDVPAYRSAFGMVVPRLGPHFQTLLSLDRVENSRLGIGEMGVHRYRTLERDRGGNPPSLTSDSPLAVMMSS